MVYKSASKTIRFKNEAMWRLYSWVNCLFHKSWEMKNNLDHYIAKIADFAVRALTSHLGCFPL